MKKPLLILLWLLPLCSHAQHSDPSLLLKLNLSSIADAFTVPTIQLSAEKSIGRHFSALAELGYIAPLLLQQKQRAYRASAELRYYARSLEGRAVHRQFIGLRPAYYYRYSTTHADYYHNTSTSIILHDDFKVTRNYAGLSLLGGDQMLYRHLCMDFSFGLGAIYKQIANGPRAFNPDTDGLTDRYQNFIERLSIYNSLDRNSGWKLNFSITARIGYVWYKKAKAKQGR